MTTPTPDTCPHESWQEIGGARKCEDCGEWIPGERRSTPDTVEQASREWLAPYGWESRTLRSLVALLREQREAAGAESHVDCVARGSEALQAAVEAARREGFRTGVVAHLLQAERLADKPGPPGHWTARQDFIAELRALPLPEMKKE